MNISIIKGKDNGCIYIKGEVYINGEVIYLNKYKKLRDAFTKKEQKVILNYLEAKSFIDTLFD
jgi:hypothetical protein